jgi:hypothetical protein
VRYYFRYLTSHPAKDKVLHWDVLHWFRNNAEQHDTLCIMYLDGMHNYTSNTATHRCPQNLHRIRWNFATRWRDAVVYNERHSRLQSKILNLLNIRHTTKNVFLFCPRVKNTITEPAPSLRTISTQPGTTNTPIWQQRYHSFAQTSRSRTCYSTLR